MRQTALEVVYELAKKDPRVVFVGSDLGPGVLEKMKKEMPERFYMEGISEQHLIGMCTGLAMEGFIPYFNTIGTFLTRRCYEQIVLDACLHRQKIRLLSTGGGVVYAPLGPTHLAIEDISLMRTLPHMTVFAPSDAVQMRALMPHTLDIPGPVFVRIAKGGDPVVTPTDEQFIVGKVYVRREGQDVALVTTGITLRMALEAAETLAKDGISARVLHLPTIKPLDEAGLLSLLTDVRAVVTIEEHLRTGGLGSLVAELLAEAALAKPKKFARIGIPDKFTEEYGSQDSLMKTCGISAAHTVEVVREQIS
jgi:transketolase